MAYADCGAVQSDQASLGVVNVWPRPHYFYDSRIVDTSREYELTFGLPTKKYKDYTILAQFLQKALASGLYIATGGVTEGTYAEPTAFENTDIGELDGLANTTTAFEKHQAEGPYAFKIGISAHQNYGGGIIIGDCDDFQGGN
jgi:hypothetical protein